MPKLLPLLVVLLAPLFLPIFPPPVVASAPSPDEAAIRAAFARWTDAFDAGRAVAVCDLFSTDLAARFRGVPERAGRWRIFRYLAFDE